MNFLKPFTAAVFVAFLYLNNAVAADSEPANRVAGDATSNIVVMQTNQGDIVIELAAEEAPKTVANFKEYVSSGFYNGTIFHRVMPGFMVQGGGFDAELTQKTTAAPVQNEADNGLQNVTGSLAMARTSAPHSATAQFFINVNDNDFLNHSAKNARGWGYAVFGRVTEGLDIVTAISKQVTKRQGQHGNVPVETVLIEKVYFR